jgi:hypothetical protein
MRHLTTAVILLVAMAFYVVGLADLGKLAFVAGAVFEAWFWARLLSRRPRLRAERKTKPG